MRVFRANSQRGVSRGAQGMTPQKDAECSVVRGDHPELAGYLRIEERALEVGAELGSCAT